MLRLILILILLITIAFIPNAFALRLHCTLPEEVITACEVEINGTVYTGSCFIDGDDYDLIDLISHITGLNRYTIRARWIGEGAEAEYSNWSNLYMLFVDRKFVRDNANNQVTYDIPGYGKGQW